MNFFLKHIEIHLSVAGVLVILIIPSLFSSTGTTLWKLTAITAVVVGVIHGAIFWIVRNRQRQIRNEVINNIQNSLLDTINNNLQIINLGIEKLSGNKEEEKQAVVDTRKAISNISSSLDSISAESLKYSEYNY